MEGSNSESACRKGKGAAERPETYPMGTVGELLRIGGAAGRAALSVVFGSADESVTRMDSGDFSVVLVRRWGTLAPLSLPSCVVGEHQWPLAPDSPVLRVGPRRFSFAFPGFFYGLELPEGCFDDDVRRLECILLTFCSYENHVRNQDSDFCTGRSNANFWASAYANIKMLSFGPPPIGAPRGPSAAVRPVHGHGHGHGTREEKTTLKWERALRTSAATKLVAKVLLTDTVGTNLHVEVTGAAAATSPASAQRGPYVLASLRAISDVVDAVEAMRGVGEGGWSMAPGHWPPPLPEGDTHWHFNVAGLTLVLQALAAVGAQTNASELPAGEGRGEGSSSSHGSHASGRPSVAANQNLMGGPPAGDL